MRQPSKLVSFRLSAEVYKDLRAVGGRLGMSPGGAAREAVLEKLSQSKAAGDVTKDVWKEARTLRKELASATEAILFALSADEKARARASAWVRNNLNR